MKTGLLILLAAMSFASQGYSAQAQTAVKMLEQLQKLHNQRLDADGVVIEDDALTQNFINEQNKVITALKNGKLLGYSFTISNSFKTDVIVTVSTIQEKGSLVGALVESSYYKDAAAEATLRAVNLKGIRKGMDAMIYEGQTLAHIKSNSALSPKAGGLITIQYPTDFNDAEYGSENLNILKSSDGNFAFYREDRSVFTSVYLDIWFNIFTRNFGIREVIFE